MRRKIDKLIKFLGSRLSGVPEDDRYPLPRIDSWGPFKWTVFRFVSRDPALPIGKHWRYVGEDGHRSVYEDCKGNTIRIK